MDSEKFCGQHVLGGLFEFKVDACSDQVTDAIHTFGVHWHLHIDNTANCKLSQDCAHIFSDYRFPIQEQRLPADDEKGMVRYSW